MRNMWSVNTVPKVSSLSFGFRFLLAARVVLPRVDEHRHDVPATAAGLGDLLEPPLDPGRVAGGLEPPDLLDLLALHRLVDPEGADRALLAHRLLVHAHD